MKKLACEMCGSNDLVKDGGLFVCQHCGCKYTVEEAKKMMIEGTVKVEGKVSIDRSEELENYLKLSESALRTGDTSGALGYAIDALNISAQDPKAWIAKMNAISRTFFNKYDPVSDIMQGEIKEAGNSALALAGGDERVASSVYSAYLERAAFLFQYSCLAKEAILSRYVINYARELVSLVPDEAFEKFAVLAFRLDESADKFFDAIKMYEFDMKREHKGAFYEGSKPVIAEYRAEAQALKDKAASLVESHLERILDGDPNLKAQYTEKVEKVSQLEERYEVVCRQIPYAGGFGKKKREEKESLIREESALSVRLIPEAKKALLDFKYAIAKQDLAVD